MHKKQTLSLLKPGGTVSKLPGITLESGINVAPRINVALENLAKRISVDPFIPYTYTNKHRAMFIPDTRVNKQLYNLYWECFTLRLKSLYHTCRQIFHN